MHLFLRFVIVCGVLLPYNSSVAQNITLPGGSFIMGHKSGNVDEQPPRKINVTPFSIGRTEVTEAQYLSCVKKGICTSPHYDDTTCRVWNGTRFKKVNVPASARNPDYPVVCVTWQQARHYCRAQGLSLPSEAQWEYAARAGATTRYPWGDQKPTTQKCVIQRTTGPKKVGSCSPNTWGVVDMIGNAWEWVSDFYDRSAYQVELSGPSAGFYRVIRGGGWYSGSDQAHVANRQWFSPGFAEVSIGFRCVKK